MCRSIKKLYNNNPGSQEIHDAAVQFVRKVSGMRKPSKPNEKAFEEAVNNIAQQTDTLLNTLSYMNHKQP